MDVHKFSMSPVWDLIDKFITYTVEVGIDTVTIKNKYKVSVYPIRTEQEIDIWDRIIDIGNDYIVRKHGLVKCYNETKREHFFMQVDWVDNHLKKWEGLVNNKEELFKNFKKDYLC